MRTSGAESCQVWDRSGCHKWIALTCDEVPPSITQILTQSLKFSVSCHFPAGCLPLMKMAAVCSGCDDQTIRDCQGLARIAQRLSEAEEGRCGLKSGDRGSTLIILPGYCGRGCAGRGPNFRSHSACWSHAILRCMDTPPSLHRATRSSASGIVALRDSLARWQQKQAIQQWSPGELSIGQVAEQIDLSEWWISSEGNKILAAVRLTDSDELIWPDRNPAAAYIHGLMVDRSLSGQKFGQKILKWAEEEIHAKGCSVVRLDCVATNENLRNYYEKLGYRECGVVDFGPHSAWHPVLKLEKVISSVVGEL